MASKSRFTATDVKAMVRDIRSTLLGQRVANVYNITDKIYMFKFAIPGVSEKIMLLMESGIRFHTTKYTRDKNDMPSPFAMKLRKYIRTKRLEDVRQLGSDRVVDFKFGSGDAVCHIILELYASGNIVLTDGAYEIQALLRSHQFEDDVAVKMHEIYPIAFTTTAAEARNESQETVLNMTRDQFSAWALAREATASVASNQAESKKSAKKNKARKLTMRQLLLNKDSGVAAFGPEIIDHCLLSSNIPPSSKVSDVFSSTDTDSIAVDALLKELQNGHKLLSLLDTPGQPGYILLRSNPNNADSEGDYFDFVPRLFMQHENERYKEMPSFDETVDEYFCKVEEQRMQHQAEAAEEHARKKVIKVRQEMENQLKGFEDQQSRMQQAAAVVEANAEQVDKVCLVINSALAAGLSWDDIGAMVATETAAGNPIASLVAKLRLDKNHVILRLPTLDDESDEDDYSDSDEECHSAKKSQPRTVEVEVDLGLTAYANASKLYTQKKVARTKGEKTAQATERAIQAVEEQTTKQLESQKVKRNLQALRKVHWFEKFNWFVTSEGYLVLSGRDAQQNEALVKRYLRPGDAYVHADMHGASSCIVRCKIGKDSNPLPISPFALQEAGTMTICRSGAWAVKVVTSAWWVHASQVSKTAPSGEYLTTGSFMIYGRKNFLPPTQLEMGFGILFRLDDASVARHLGDRKDRSVEFEDESNDTRSMISEMSDRYQLEVTPTSVIGARTNDNSLHEGNKLGSEYNEKGNLGQNSDKVAQDVQTRDQISEPDNSSVPIDDRGHNPEDAHSTEGNPGSTKLSAHQKRMLKKEKKAAMKADTVKSVTDTPAKDESVSNDVNTEKKSTGTKGGSKSKKSAPESTQSEKAEEPPSGFKRKKAPNKKRYAHQDEEDLELAMRALGHSRPGGSGTLGELQKQEQEETKQKEKQRKQEKAGIHMLEDNWTEALQLLDAQVRAALEDIISQGHMKEGEIDAFEISTLAAFKPEHGLKILELFTEDGSLQRIRNKSGFLAGIMRRYSKTIATSDSGGVDDNSKLAEDMEAVRDTADMTTESRRERKKKEQMEIQAILEEEGILDEQEGKQADELEKLTGMPLPEDVLLYAVPVCGPYCSMQNMKYRVKLTPGTTKKGKAAKHAVEVFINSKECSPHEKALIKGLSDPEMVAIMIGDVKLSVPGLYTTLKNKKSEKKNASKAKMKKK